LIAAGAGAGLAAAFDAPIAGVLFVVEELLQDVSGITLGTAILASFIGAVVSRLLGNHSLNLDLHLAAPPTSFFAEEIPFYVILGVLAGLLGALFNQGVLLSLKLNRKWVGFGVPLRVGLAGLVSGIIVALLPIAFRDNAGLRELLLTGHTHWQFSVIAFVAQFFLILVAAGSGAPGGLLVPTLLLGAALGYIVGTCEHSMLGMSLATTYARVGMATFFSAVARVPITAIILIFELSTDFNLVLPLMIASVTAYLVAEMVTKGSIYDLLLEWNGIHLEEEETPARGIIAQLTASNVMQRRVETLACQMTLDEVMQAFSSSHHRGFPVVEDGKLVGIVTQTDLANIAQRQLPGDTALSEIMTPHPVTVSPTDSLSHVLYLLNRNNLSRLPVIQGRKLVGIITRGDIIRAEADQLRYNTDLGPRPEPSYVVYQTRSPAVGRGRLLVPLANPRTSGALLELAGAIARDRHYELDCLQVIMAPRHHSPSEANVNTAKSRRLLRQAEVKGRQWKVPVHTEVRVAHDVASAILETIKERHIDLILMGWEGKSSTPGRIFGSVVDTLIRQAPCEVVLVKLGNEDNGQTGNGQYRFNRWLVPMSGGPNAKEAIQLLPALVKLGNTPEVHLCQVFEPSDKPANTTLLEQARRDIIRDRKFSSKITTAPIKASSVSEGVINLVKQDDFDVVVLGASREGLLQQAIKGNIPEAIASRVESTVILVRSAIDQKS
jgi:CIC family chloride channel protein